MAKKEKQKIMAVRNALAWPWSGELVEQNMVMEYTIFIIAYQMNCVFYSF